MIDHAFARLIKGSEALADDINSRLMPNTSVTIEPNEAGGLDFTLKATTTSTLAQLIEEMAEPGDGDDAANMMAVVVIAECVGMSGMACRIAGQGTAEATARVLAWLERE